MEHIFLSSMGFEKTMIEYLGTTSFSAYLSKLNTSTFLMSGLRRYTY